MAGFRQNIFLRVLQRNSRDRTQDMLLKTATQAQDLVPPVDVGQLWSLDRVAVPAVNQDAVADIRQAELRARQIGAVRDKVLHDPPTARRLPAGGYERRGIALLLRRAVIADQ